MRSGEKAVGELHTKDEWGVNGEKDKVKQIPFAVPE